MYAHLTKSNLSKTDSVSLVASQKQINKIQAV